MYLERADRTTVRSNSFLRELEKEFGLMGGRGRIVEMGKKVGPRMRIGLPLDRRPKKELDRDRGMRDEGGVLVNFAPLDDVLAPVFFFPSS